MDASNFGTSRIHKERSFDLVSKICNELGTADDRLYLAYAERGISRIQDGRYEVWRGQPELGSPFAGQVEESNTLLLDSLAGREKALGKNDRESVRTGLILYALGNLHAAQNQWDESFKYHQRAWHHMRETVGERDFYTQNALKS